MKFTEYAAHDAVGLAELIRHGEVSPLEVVDAAIEGIELYDRDINAIVYRAFDGARAAAAGPLPEGPFTGVPFLVKDLLLQVEGWPRTSGSRYAANAGFADAQDSGLMRRYRASGVITLGKTNLSEFGIAGTTEGALFGPCRNPWDLEHIVGGSSGGSAAAVASGMVPMAHGGDGLGSIRIPASCCGLVGLKVTRDRNPHLPDGYDFAQGNVVEHVITRTVRDTAVMLDVTGNPEPGSPYAIPPKERPYADEVGRDPGRLRIAWSGATPLGRAIHPDVQAVLEETARMLDGLGHYLEERALGTNTLSDYIANLPLAGANFAAGMKRMIEAIGREPAADELEPLTWAALNVGCRRALQRAGTPDASSGDASLFRGLGHIPVPGDGNPTAQDRLSRSDQRAGGRHPGPKWRGLSLRCPVQFHRSALNLAAARSVARGFADRNDVLGALRR
jgi:amidase